MKNLKFYLAALSLVGATSGLVAKQAQFAQLSLSHDLRPETTEPTKVPLDLEDGLQGMTNNNGEVTVGESGVYAIFAAPQVGTIVAPGAVKCWLRVNDKDVDNSNVLIDFDC